MARPIRCRRICFEPKYDSFAPRGSKNMEQVMLTVDEFEAVRLIDHEKKPMSSVPDRWGFPVLRSRKCMKRTGRRLRTAL